jgi:hypothetical protein
VTAIPGKSNIVRMQKKLAQSKKLADDDTNLSAFLLLTTSGSYRLEHGRHAIPTQGDRI